MSRRSLVKAAGLQLTLIAFFSFAAGAGWAADDAAAYAISRGSDLLGEEQYQEAINFFNQAIENKPDSVKAYEFRARTYAELGEYPKALEDYKKLISMAPNTLAYVSERSMVYLQLQDYPKAVDDLTRLISSGQDVMAYYTRGWAYGQIGQHEKAIADYTQFIQDTKDDTSRADGYYNRGNEYFELNQSQKALDDFTQASKLDAKQKVAAANSRGLVGEHRDISLVPDYAKAYYRCGLVYSTLGKPQNAIENFTRAIAINPDLPDFYKARALAYEKLGLHDKAKADQDKASKSVSGSAAGKQAAAGAQGQQKVGLQLAQKAKPGTRTGAAGAEQVADPAKFDRYLTELEKKNLGRVYTDDLIPERLERIESKLFGKAQAGSFKQRLEQLMLKSGQ